MTTRTASSPSQQPSLRYRRASGCAGRHLSRRQGFTILELMVVIAIAAIVGAITLGGFAQLGASQKRTTCQTNMTQIYEAARLYQADEGSFPFYNPEGSTPEDRNIGLWALYTFPDFANTNGLRTANAESITRYLKSINTLHCPQDSELGHNARILPNGSEFNTDFLSYQGVDAGSDGVPDYDTYKSWRVDTKTDADWRRQLIPNISSAHIAVPRPPADDTVVTWCRWHRAAAGSRQYDNVLFYDGSVQLIPRTDQNGKTGWYRTRRPPL